MRMLLFAVHLAFYDAAGDGLVGGEAGNGVEVIAGDEGVDVRFAVTVEHVHRPGQKVVVKIRQNLDRAEGGLQRNAITLGNAEQRKSDE